MPSSISHVRNAKETTVKYHYTLTNMGKMEEAEHPMRIDEGACFLLVYSKTTHGEKRTILHCWRV